MKLISALSFLALSSVSTSASAAETVTMKQLNPWTDCGIGAMIFVNYPVAAVISNVIWDLGTTAVTSNYSSQNTCSGSNAKVAMLVGTSYANLEEETVKGDGKHLQAMLGMMNCDTTARGNIIRSVRTDFNRSLENAAYAEQATMVKAESYYNLVQAKVTGEFASQCQAI
ncbi:MAG: DUF3015 family protein [Gallionella sp.]|nr:DUF3015 family protein [Gallionella sp.]